MSCFPIHIYANIAIFFGPGCERSFHDLLHVDRTTQAICRHICDQYVVEMPKGYTFRLEDMFGHEHSVDDRPTIEINSARLWMQHGLFHHIVYQTGAQIWCHRGKCHRDERSPPAVIFNPNSMEWWQNGRRTIVSHQFS